MKRLPKGQRPTTLQAAMWIADNPQGVTCGELAAHFEIDRSTASGVMQCLRGLKSVETHWEEGIGHYASKERVPGRLSVTAINDRKWHGIRHGSIVAVPTNPLLDILHYGSAYEAELCGGFTGTDIYRCLRGEQSAHSGYKWYTKAEYEQVLIEGLELYQQCAYSE